MYTRHSPAFDQHVGSSEGSLTTITASYRTETVPAPQPTKQEQDKAAAGPTSLKTTSSGRTVKPPSYLRDYITASK